MFPYPFTLTHLFTEHQRRKTNLEIILRPSKLIKPTRSLSPGTPNAAPSRTNSLSKMSCSMRARSSFTLSSSSSKASARSTSAFWAASSARTPKATTAKHKPRHSKRRICKRNDGSVTAGTKEGMMKGGYRRKWKKGWTTTREELECICYRWRYESGGK